MKFGDGFFKRRIHLAKNWKARLLLCRIFQSGRSPTLRLLLAVRYSPLAFATRPLPFAFFSARQEPRSPKDSPTKVGAKILRHQLRTEARSMICFWLLRQLWIKVFSMVCF